MWVGLETRKTIFQGADGGKVALPIWVEFMKVALANTPREEFPVPEGMDWAEVDRCTGLLATGDTPSADRVSLAFKPGTGPAAPSTLEAITIMREARDKARARAVDIHPWVENN